MSFTDIKTKNQGFTIVELLIVVVVIAILAAITIVSYNGITNKANSSSAASAAASVQKKMELYAADESTAGYPTTITDITNSANSTKTYYLSGITVQQAAPTSSNGKTTVSVLKCVAGSSPANQAAITTAGSVTGLIIRYFDFENQSTLKTINVGNVGNGGTACPTS